MGSLTSNSPTIVQAHSRNHEHFCDVAAVERGQSISEYRAVVCALLLLHQKAFVVSDPTAWSFDSSIISVWGAWGALFPWIPTKRHSNRPPEPWGTQMPWYYGITFLLINKATRQLALNKENPTSFFIFLHLREMC